MVLYYNIISFFVHIKVCVINVLVDIRYRELIIKNIFCNQLKLCYRFGHNLYYRSNAMSDFMNKYGGLVKTTKDAPKKEPMTVEGMFENSLKKQKGLGVSGKGSWYDKKKGMVIPKVGIFKLYDGKEDGFKISEGQFSSFIDDLEGEYKSGNLSKNLDIIRTKQKEAILKRQNKNK